MGVLSDGQIEALGSRNIDPFIKGRCPGKISFGLTSFGYDVRLAPLLRITHDVSAGLIDPKRPDVTDLCFSEPILPAKDFVTKDKFFVIPPHGFALGESMEKIVVPRDVLVICLGKSTYARCGLIVNVTPLEPEWEGTITLEISNTTPHPARVYAEEGIAQLIFLRGEQPCVCSYADKQGKYQHQRGIQLPKVS